VPGRRRRRRAERGAGQLTTPAAGPPARAADGGTAARRLLFAPDGRLRAPVRLALYALALVAGVLLAQSFVYPVAALALRAAGLRPTLANWTSLAAVAIAHVLVLRLVERRPVADVGLDATAARPGRLAAGAVLGALAIAVPTAALLAAGQLRVVPSVPGSWAGAAAHVVGWELAPAALYEELLVRGYPFLVLRESLGALPALLVTSVVFGLLHAANPGATPAFVAVVTLAGVFLGAVLLATRSLWAAWAAHLAWNVTITAGFHAAVSGLSKPAPNYRVVDAGPDWLTGGLWGPEGGAAAAAGMLGALALLHFRAGRARRVGHAAAHAALADRAA
jgi:membrane protease YdiL (CAAX protease family)